MSLAERMFGLIAWLLLCFVAAGVGGVASIDAAVFYGRLTRPDWAPAATVFGPIWTLLYALMAVGAWLVWGQGGFRHHARALTVFIAQLALNALWTWLFFAWRSGAWALLDIVLLDVLIAATVVMFWRSHKMAGVLMVPYLAWVSYASALTWALLSLNPARLS